MVIIGSKALSFYIPGIKYKDIDLIGSNKDVDILSELLNPKKIKTSDYSVVLFGIDKNFNELYDVDNLEIHLIEKSESLKLYYEYSNPEKINIKLAPLEVLFSIKKSHIHYPVNFEKHINSYCILNDIFNGVDSLEYITKIRIEETENRLGKIKTPSLNKSVSEFFGQSEGYVKYYFEHDDIHIAVSHYEEPIYRMMQSDYNIVKCDKSKWDNFDFEKKCKCVLEEAYVIALERKIFPMLFGGSKLYTSDDSFKWAMNRICTNLTSGWFRKFATDNYNRIVENYYNPKYVDDFLEKYEMGTIKMKKDKF